jgi:hypothetical protein
MEAVSRSSSFNAVVMGLTVKIELEIRSTYEACINFSLHGMPYTFTITRWSRRGFAKFATIFFNYKQRDPARFGHFSEDADGTVNFSMTTDQKLNVIEEGIRDIISCINMIGVKYQRSILDYAVWYREKYPNDDTYESFITLYACHCIVHSDFMAPNITWEVIQFSG